MLKNLIHNFYIKNKQIKVETDEIAIQSKAINVSGNLDVSETLSSNEIVCNKLNIRNTQIPYIATYLYSKGSKDDVLEPVIQKIKSEFQSGLYSIDGTFVVGSGNCEFSVLDQTYHTNQTAISRQMVVNQINRLETPELPIEISSGNIMLGFLNVRMI